MRTFDDTEDQVLSKLNLEIENSLSAFQAIREASFSDSTTELRRIRTSRHPLYQTTTTFFDAAGTPDLADQAWKMYVSALRANIQGGDSWENLQIVALPTPVLWDDPEFGPYYFHVDAGDYIPENGSTYRKSDRSFSERYKAFVADIQRNPIDEQALADAETALTAAHNAEGRHGEFEDTLAREWQAYDTRQRQADPNSPGLWERIESYYERKRFYQQLNASQAIVSAHFAKFYALMQKAFGGQETLYMDIIERFSNTGKVAVTFPRIGTTQSAKIKGVLPYQVSPDFPSWLLSAKAGIPQPVRFTLTRNSGSVDYSNTQIGGGFGLGFGFFGLYAGGNRTTITLDSTSQSFKLDFAGIIQTFDVSPGDWYSSSAFELFRNGPFFPNSPIDMSNKTNSLWGPKGYLNFRAARYVVVYKPKVTIQLEYHDYHSFYEQTRGAAGFCIGPWVIGGGSYYKEERHVRWDDQSLTITIYDGPDIPQLLAVDSRAL